MCRGQSTAARALVGSALLASVLWLSGCVSAAVEPPGEAAAPADEVAASETDALENTLRWKTASEVDNFGFDVYRGPTEEGPFERLNEEPIAGGGTTDEPQHYSYVDDTIESGVEYWYYVESISMNGEREKFTPVFKAKVKYATDG